MLHVICHQANGNWSCVKIILHICEDGQNPRTLMTSNAARLQRCRYSFIADGNVIRYSHTAGFLQTMHILTMCLAIMSLSIYLKEVKTFIHMYTCTQISMPCPQPNWGMCVYLVAQSSWTLCHPVDCSPPGSSVPGDSPGKTTGVGCHALLHEIFPTQELYAGLLHCR